MEFDITTLLYLLFGLAYFVLMGRKKKKKTPQRRPPQQGSTTVNPSPSQRPTFEELLKEFTGERREPEPVYEPMVEMSPEPVYKAPTFEEKPKSYTQVPTPSKSFTKFNRYEEKVVEESEYARLFSDTEGARRAFVLGEIFNRKY